MKWKIVACAVILVLILAQIIYGGKKAPSGSVPAAVQAGEALPHDTAAAEEPPPPLPAAVTAIAVGENGDGMRLSRSGDGWILVGDGDAPADGEKVHALLHSLLVAPRGQVSLGDSESTGLADGAGLPISLTLADGSTYDILLGLRPAGSYASAYVRFPDDGVKIVTGDVRGSLGLWRNIPGAEPDPSAWLEKRALTFYVSDVVRIEATYPDHRIVFEKSPDHVWQARDYVPGGEWERAGLVAWLTDLSEFQIAGVVPSDEFSHDDAGKTHGIILTLADGTVKTVRVQPNHGGEGMLAVTSDYPDRVFHLAEWRFKKYFRRLSSLFPMAVPNYDLSQVRFIDILRGGNRVKMARRDDGWRPVNLEYPLRVDHVERLVRLLSSWRPEDYAAPDPKAARPHSGGPLVEISLEGGDVYQYRLGGRHPLFPWRYVTLNGREVFSVTDPEAGVMFPDFAEVLDLGRVFRRMPLEDVDSVRVSALDGAMAYTFFRNADGSWSIGDGERELGLTPFEAERILGELSQWRVTGFYNIDTYPARHPPQYLIRLGGSEGGEEEITILQPEERDIPYLTENGRGYLVDRADFQNWLGEVREAGDRLAKAAQQAQEETPEREAEAAGPEDAADSPSAPDAEPREDGESVLPESPADEGDRLREDEARGDRDSPDGDEAIPPPAAEREDGPEPLAEDEPAGADESGEEHETGAADERQEPAPEGAIEVERVAAESEGDAVGADEAPSFEGEPGIIPGIANGTTPGEDGREEESVAEVLGESKPAPIASDEADDSEETAGEPAGGDVLVHPDVDENVVGSMIRDVTGEDDALVPGAEVVHGSDASPVDGE